MNQHDPRVRDEPVRSPDSEVVDYGCPLCGEPLQSPDSMVAQFDTCPMCGSIFTVPKPTANWALLTAIVLTLVVVAALAATAFIILRRGQ